MGGFPVKTRISRELVAKVASQLMGLARGESKPLRLPSERQLSEKFDISRRAVRLAIQILENKNLVVRKQGSGNYLLPQKLSIRSTYLIVPSDIKTDDPYYSLLISQFTMYAQEHNVHLIPVRSEPGMLLNADIPGIITGRISQNELQKVSSSIDVLVSMANMETDLCCQVVFDDFDIGARAARKFSDFGHSHVLFLAGPESEFSSARNRLEGFLSESGKLGLRAEIYRGKMNWRSGYELLKDYLARTSRSDCATGIFASNDWMAAGALQAIAEAGLGVPDDFSLIGCDDIPLASQLQPPLATFRLDPAKFVEQTFIALEQAWRLQLPKKIILSAEFIKRNSLMEHNK